MQLNIEHVIIYCSGTWSYLSFSYHGITTEAQRELSRGLNPSTGDLGMCPESMSHPWVSTGHKVDGLVTISEQLYVFPDTWHLNRRSI